MCDLTNNSDTLVWYYNNKKMFLHNQETGKKSEAFFNTFWKSTQATKKPTHFIEVFLEL